MFGIEWLVIGLLILASLNAVVDAALDGIALITNPGGEAPSLAKRRARAELAQQQAAARVELAERQAAAGVPPAPGQAAADWLARFIANPPPWPRWVIAGANYLGLLLADRLARARRRHVAKENERLQRERGEQPHHPHSGPYCRHCDVNPVAEDGDLCKPCTMRVLEKCSGCSAFVPVVDLRDKRCSACRATARTARAEQPPTSDGHGGVQLVVPMLPAAQPDPHRY